MVKPFASPAAWIFENIAAPPGQPLCDGLTGDPYEEFQLIT